MIAGVVYVVFDQGPEDGDEYILEDIFEDRVDAEAQVAKNNTGDLHRSFFVEYRVRASSRPFVVDSYTIKDEK